MNLEFLSTSLDILISLNEILYLSMYKFCIPFRKCIPNHFISFYAIENGTVFLTSFLDCPLLVDRNIINLCILFLYFVASLNFLKV